MSKKEKSKKKKEKEVYIEKKGILGNADDYHVYHMKPADYAVGYLLGFASAAAASYIFFSSTVFSVIVGAVIGIFSIKLYKKHLLKKRKQNLLLQFKDMLESINNSYAAGKNTPDAFMAALSDMQMQYGMEVDIIREISIINAGVQNGYNIEEMLTDFADRSELEDIESFADVFTVCNRLGGDLKRVVSESYDIIRDKIEIEIEINSIVTGSKNELNVMVILPFVVSLMTRSFTGSDGSTNAVTVIVNIIAIAIIAVSYVIGLKMTKIKV